jgi:hypothetical protein
MAKPITVIRVKNEKAPGLHRDFGTPGLYLKVTPKGNPVLGVPIQTRGAAA